MDAAITGCRFDGVPATDIRVQNCTDVLITANSAPVGGVLTTSGNTTELKTGNLNL